MRPKGQRLEKRGPDDGQQKTEKVNGRGEKIHESANVLANMQLLEPLLREIGFEETRKGDQDHLRTVLIPAATAAMNDDDGRGRLTAELARQISDNAREIRKGVLEQGRKVKVYDEYSDGIRWPDRWDSKLLWPLPPWWILTAFLAAIAFGIFLAETQIYEKAKSLVSTEEPAEEREEREDEGDAEPSTE